MLYLGMDGHVKIWLGLLQIIVLKYRQNVVDRVLQSQQPPLQPRPHRQPQRGASLQRHLPLHVLRQQRHLWRQQYKQRLKQQKKKIVSTER